MKTAQIFARCVLGAAPLLFGAAAPLLGAAGCGDDVQVNPISTLDGGDAGPGMTNDGGGGEAGPEAGLTVNIPNLTAPVHAVYDEFGFLHVSGKTDDDVFATVGYFHAANRFFFMDFLRNAVRGTLGKLLVFPGIVDGDVTRRTFFSTPQGDPLPEKLVSQADAATKESLDAYARGVNAWLADVKAGRNGAKLTEDYTFSIISKDLPRDWEPADSMAVALYSLNDLSNNASSETTLGRVAQTALGLQGTRPAVAKTLADLFLDFRPTFDAYTIPAAQTAPMNFLPPGRAGGASGPYASYDPAVQKLLASATARLAALPAALPLSATGDHGSNNWVIAGARATNGRPLLANDPHLSLTNPSIWFPIEIDSKSNGGTGKYHAAGGSFPGSPTVQTGHNENIAWGVTVTYWDLADVYLETLTKGGTAVSFNGADVDLVTKDVMFFDQGNTVTRKLTWVPHHGPIVSVDPVAGTAVSIRWRGHDGSTDVQAFFELDRAGSIAEAKAALANITTANQNFVVADKAGKIGYFPYAKVPTRPWASSAPGSSPFFPLTGNGTREWGPPVALTDIPQLEDPPAGFIATANGDMNGATMDGDPLNAPWTSNQPIQTVSRAEGTRIQRILESIVATGKNNTIETMRLLQGDTRSLVAVTVVPRLLAAATEAGVVLTPETQHLVDALAAWNTAAQYTCPTGLDGIGPLSAKSPDAVLTRESIGCSAFHASLYSLIEAAFGDELRDPAVGLNSASTNNTIPVLMRSLRNATYDPTMETYWQDINTTDHVTTRSEILRRALVRAGAILAQLGLSDEWRWGRMHTLRLLSPLSQPGMNQFDSQLYATPGGLLTVNVASPSNVDVTSTNATRQRDFSHTSGPSIRTLIEVGTDSPHMKVTLPGGSDLHRQSKFYNNMVPNWLANTPVDFAFGPGAVKNPAADITVVAP
jgi:penicillin amidase